MYPININGKQMNKDKTINIGTPKSIYKIFKNIFIILQKYPYKKIDY